jgi:preprotein translocase subunit SecE
MLEVRGSMFDFIDAEPRTLNLITPTKIMNKVSNYFRDSYKELAEKVTWPNWLQLQQSTMIVLAATLLITAMVAIMDLISSSGLKFIYKIF